MSGYQPYDDSALDGMLDTAMNGILAKLEAAFDPGAGLADIYARSTAHRPVPTTAPPRPGGTGGSPLEEACDHIDLVTAWLADLITSGQRTPFAGSSFLELARDNLIELRAGLANRTMARPQARALATDIESQLGRADHILRSSQATSLDRLASQCPGHGDSLTGQVQLLHQIITRLYAPDGDDLSLEPAR